MLKPDRPPNRLINQTSPYLLQHAYNPVDWHPWNQEALSKAKSDNKPILLSIGYSACHWCHVMERESFENKEIAKLMNQSFVCIKVDREERPDLDDIYMQATLAMNQGNGGWPMTVFLTPDQQPIFAGTYFPPTDRWGRPGFSTVLKKIAEGWEKDQPEILASAGRFTGQLQQAMRVSSSMTVGQDQLDAAVAQYTEHFEPQYGGFGNAPKFPPATGLSFLLGQYTHTHDEQTLHMVTKTLDAMAAGGMYDHIGGGFARYSTDDRWLVPHFEKMLYDNALLACTYLEGFQVTRNQEYRRITTEILDYTLREMTSPEGGFYSATDADSEGVEGKFFIWTPEEIRAIIPDAKEAALFCAYFDITDEGNWEGNSIPHTPRSLDEVAKEQSCSPDTLRNIIERNRPVVYDARLKRVPPGLDDKIITAWNGMMICAMAEAARVLGQPRYLEAATNAADFLLLELSRPDGGLFRTYRGGKAHLNGYLEDYAYLIEALVYTYEAAGEEKYLTQAVRLADRLIADFSDTQHGGYFTTANDHEMLILRTREGPDGATPSGNAVAALALARLAFHYDRSDYRESATSAIRAYGRHISQIPRGFAKTLIAVDLLIQGPVELALVGMSGDSGYEQLCQTAHQFYLPHRVIGYHNPNGPTSYHPLLQGKTLVNGQAALYICRNFACGAPITDYEKIGQHLQQSMNPRSGDQEGSSPPVLSAAGISGAATPTETASYVSRILTSAIQSHPSASGYTVLGNTGLTTSRVGFGGYRIDAENESFHQALIKAIREGCNLIDTSTNYADGGSEQLIGSVMAQLIREGELHREEIIVVSKIGYIQGQNLKQAESREKSGQPYPEVVKYGEGLWHCLHPDFLAEQLTRSLDRLGLATLDVCLLHNPEYFLSDAKNQNPGIASDELNERRTEFYQRLHQAFAYCEGQVQAGRLQYYGVSSNTCTASPDDPEATSLSLMLEAAEAAARDAGVSAHHLRVLQLPMNLFEADALFVPNTGRDHTQTVLDLAQQEQIALLVNRPLNAIPSKKAGMLRLADPVIDSMETSFDNQCQIVRDLEAEYRTAVAPLVPYSGKGMQPKDFFSWAEELTKVRTQLQSLEHWEQIESHMIGPHINQVVKVISKHLTGNHTPTWQTWRDRYFPELLTLFRIMQHQAAKKNRERAQVISALIDPFLPTGKKSESLARKALWTVASTPGVTCVLNGMRSPEYVTDSLGILSWEPLTKPHPIFQAVATATQSS